MKTPRDAPATGSYMTHALLGSFSAQFTWIDWSVVVVYFALTTWIATALAGRQATMRDCFLGGRKLPWYAVSGTIIATEILSSWPAYEEAATNAPMRRSVSIGS